MNAESVAQPAPWPEPKPIEAYHGLSWGYVDDLLNWLAYLIDEEAHVDAVTVEMDYDWEMDCMDVREVEMLFDLTGNLDAPV